MAQEVLTGLCTEIWEKIIKYDRFHMDAMKGWITILAAKLLLRLWPKQTHRAEENKRCYILKKLTSLISPIKTQTLLKEFQPCYHVQQQQQACDSSCPVLVWLLLIKQSQKCRSSSGTAMTLWDSEASRHHPEKDSSEVVLSSFLLRHLQKPMPESSPALFVCIFSRGI